MQRVVGRAHLPREFEDVGLDDGQADALELHVEGPAGQGLLGPLELVAGPLDAQVQLPARQLALSHPPLQRQPQVVGLAVAELDGRQRGLQQQFAPGQTPRGLPARLSGFPTRALYYLSPLMRGVS